jgi:hypothetical protein
VPCEARSHSYVYRRSQELSVGVIYQYKMVNVRDVFFLQQIAPDSVMYLVDENNRIVARNDDRPWLPGDPTSGSASEIIYRPEQSGTYTLILRSYSFFSPGYCDLYRIDHSWDPEGTLNLLERDVLFWGGTRRLRAHTGEVFETTNSTGDPFLIFIFYDWRNGRAYFGSGIDDAGAGLNSRFVTPPFSEHDPDPGEGDVTVILGSYSRSSQGECELCWEQPSALAPSRERRENIHRSHEMQQFAAQLRDTKDTLEDLEPAERERKVAELRQKILPKDERRLQFTPPPEPIPGLVPTYEEYRRLSKELDQEPKGKLSSERFRRLEELETRMLELETRMLAP